MQIPFHSAWKSLTKEPPPGLACEFTPQGVAVARWNAGSVKPERIAVRELPPDALRAQPIRENLADVAIVSAAVSSAIEEAQSVNPGKKRREIAVLLPDMSARVTVVAADPMPEKVDEVLSMIKFRLKKTVPFDIEDAAISWHKVGKEVLVAVTPRSIVRQYEAIFERLGYLPGQVTVSTLAAINLVVDSGEADGGTMLLRQCGSTTTIALSSQGWLRMMRTADSPYGSDLFRDIYSSAVFYQDTYGGRIDRIFHTGFDTASAPLWTQLEAELGVSPRPLVIPAAPDALQANYLGIFGMLAEQAKS